MNIFGNDNPDGTGGGVAWPPKSNSFGTTLFKSSFGNGKGFGLDDSPSLTKTWGTIKKIFEDGLPPKSKFIRAIPSISSSGNVKGNIAGASHLVKNTLGTMQNGFDNTGLTKKTFGGIIPLPLTINNSKNNLFGELPKSINLLKTDQNIFSLMSFNKIMDKPIAETNVLEDSAWMTQAPDWTGCFRTCCKIVGSTPPISSAIYTAQESGKSMQISTNVQKGVATINSYLANGKPIIVGVNHTIGLGYNEGTTDHFVVIMGSGQENGQTYYRFFDVGTTKITLGASKLNRFYLGSDYSLTGVTQYNKKKYTVSQVRP